MKNYKEPNFKKLAIVAAIAAAFTTPLAAHALTVSPICIGTVAAGVCTTTQPTIAKPLFKNTTQSIANTAPVVVTADAAAVYLGRQTAFSVNLTLTGATFKVLQPVGAPQLSALLATAAGPNAIADVTASVTAGGVSGAAFGSGFWTFTVAGGGAGSTSVTYTVSPKTGMSNAGVAFVPTINAGTILSYAAGLIQVDTQTLGTGGTVTITETLRDPASGLDLSTATTATLFTAANPITFASTAGSSAQKIDVGTDTTHGSKTYFSSAGTIRALDTAYFQVDSYTISVAGPGSTAGACHGISSGIANCNTAGGSAASLFRFDEAADTQTITLGGTNLAAFSVTGASVFLATASVTTNCSAGAAAVLASATLASATSITLSASLLPSAGGTYQVCLMVPTSLTNTIPAQTLTQSVAITFGNTTSLIAETAKTATTAALAYNGTVREVYFFNPAINTAQTSLLRVTNPGTTPGTVYVSGVSDAGTAGTGTATFTLPAGQAVTLTGAELETGVAVAPNPTITGALGAGLTGKKWHLTVTGEFANMAVLSVTRDAGGSLSNMSSIVHGPTAQNAN